MGLYIYIHFSLLNDRPITDILNKAFPHPRIQIFDIPISITIDNIIINDMRSGNS